MFVRVVMEEWLEQVLFTRTIFISDVSAPLSSEIGIVSKLTSLGKQYFTRDAVRIGLEKLCYSLFKMYLILLLFIFVTYDRRILDFFFFVLSLY